MKTHSTLGWLWLAMAALVAPLDLKAEHEGKLQILLVGDSTTEGIIPRKTDPEGPHLEDVVRILLAAEKDLPPCNVINLGVSGEYVRRLLDGGRYVRDVAKIPGVDYVFIRYGLNDLAKREGFDANYVKDYQELIGRLRKDHPQATLVVTTVIPYMDEEKSSKINALHREVAEKEKLPIFDLYPRYAAELKKQGPNALNYRRFPKEKIPEDRQELVKPFLLKHGATERVVVMDNRLDAHFADLPDWFSDRHPNLAGYHVIGDETAKYLAKMIREKAKK
jgi:lysophospholipase L1-like esterase